MAFYQVGLKAQLRWRAAGGGGGGGAARRRKKEGRREEGAGAVGMQVSAPARYTGAEGSYYNKFVGA